MLTKTERISPLFVRILSIHPQFIEAYSRFGTLASSINAQSLDFKAIGLRDFAVDKHGSIDDRPYGGGDSMVMRPEPLAEALRSLDLSEAHVINFSPKGKSWDQAKLEEYAAFTKPIVMVCGRFAGIDQRFIDHYVHEELSLGPFVISGGELAALCLLDGISRLLPGGLGNPLSSDEDSFGRNMRGMREYPLYTRPPVFERIEVPSVLLSGNHEAIRSWRMSNLSKECVSEPSQVVH